MRYGDLLSSQYASCQPSSQVHATVQPPPSSAPHSANAPLPLLHAFQRRLSAPSLSSFGMSSYLFHASHAVRLPSSCSAHYMLHTCFGPPTRCSDLDHRTCSSSLCSTFLTCRRAPIMTQPPTRMPYGNEPLAPLAPLNWPSATSSARRPVDRYTADQSRFGRSKHFRLREVHEVPNGASLGLALRTSTY